jgi:hypothetical protein
MGKKHTDNNYEIKTQKKWDTLSEKDKGMTRGYDRLQNWM